MATERNLTALINFESAAFADGPPQKDDINSFVAASLHSTVVEFFLRVAPSFLIIISCRRVGTENFYKEMMQRMYTIVDNMIIELVQVNHTKAYTLKRTAYVNLVLVDSLQAFLDLKLHKFAAGYDTNEYYYIFLQTRDAEIPLEMLQIFQYCWKHQLINCNVQIQNAKAEVLMYTYFPFSLDACEKSDPILIDQFMGTKWKHEIFFPDKLRNFYGCSLTAVVRNVPPYLIIRRDGAKKIKLKGLEGQLLAQLSQHYNFSLNLITPTVDERSGNWCCGTFARLEDGSAHMGLGFYRMWEFLKNNITTTFPHLQNRVVAAIYLGGYNLTTYELWTYPFGPYAWSATLLAFAVVLLIAQWLRVHYSPYMEETHSSNGLYIIAVIFGVTLHRQPNTAAQRYLFVSTLIGSFLLRAIYSALLFHVFRSNIHQPMPMTIDELFQRGYTPVVPLYNTGELNAITSKRSKTKRITVNSTNDLSVFGYLEEHYDEDLVAITSYEQLLYYVIEHNKAGMYYMLPQDVTKQQILIWLRKHSYLVDLLTQSMLRLHAAGIMEYWYNGLLSLKYFKSEHLTSDKFLGQSDLYAVYVVVMCFYTLALFIFVLELLSGKFMPVKRLLGFYYD